MRKLPTLLLGVLVVLLTACSGGSPDDPRGADVEMVEYRGHEVRCLEIGVGKAATMTCDFDSYYDEYPELLEDSSTDEDGTYWIDNGGEPLACVRRGVGESARISCDWVRYRHTHHGR